MGHSAVVHYLYITLQYCCSVSVHYSITGVMFQYITIQYCCTVQVHYSTTVLYLHSTILLRMECWAGCSLDSLQNSLHSDRPAFLSIITVNTEYCDYNKMSRYAK